MGREILVVRLDLEVWVMNYVIFRSYLMSVSQFVINTMEIAIPIS